MDIFKYAESIHFAADYYDMHTGYIYKCTEYTEDMPGIPVYDSMTNEFIGYAKRKEES